MALAALPVCAQYPGQISTTSKDTPILRAVAVFEWTGDQAHPKASRLVPVCVFDGQQLQDGGIYLARPQPLAVDPETEYQLKQNGKTIGLFDIQNDGQEQGSWVGYGTWKPLPSAHPKPAAELARNDWGEGDDADSDRPILHRKHHPDDQPSSGSGSSPSAGNAPAPDPDRPTLHRSDSSENTNAAGSGPAPDPDRPTLHSSASSQASADNSPKLKKKKKQEDDSYVQSMAALTDPDRPRLLRGKPTGDGLTVAPSLMGLPPEMHQEIAVSDARNLPDHLWSYSWANPGDEAKMKAALEDIARTDLGLSTAPPAAPAHSSSRRHAKATAPPPPPAPLYDEQFRVFELTYGSGATMVFSARTAGSGAQQKFVTLIAQPDLYGNVVVLLKNVTDAAHLDATPRMRLIDPVDALADNRGELLFELRGATQRQFALYRVLRGQISRLFVTGGGQYGSAEGE